MISLSRENGKEIVDRSPNCSFDTYKSDSIIHDIIKYLDKDRSVRDHTEVDNYYVFTSSKDSSFLF